MPSITLNSNTGDQSLVIETSIYGAELVDCELQLNARFWDGDHEQTATFSANNLLLFTSQLCELKNQLVAWLRSPQIDLVAFSGEYSLAADGYSKLDLTFGRRKDVIASNEKSVVTVRFHVGLMTGEFYFVCDQSCLGLFAQDVMRVFPDL